MKLGVYRFSGSTSALLAILTGLFCGNAWAASNGAESIKNGGDGSFSENNHTFTVSAPVYVNPSKNDSANRNERGWYAGVKITWDKKTQAATGATAEVKDNLGAHDVEAFAVYPKALTWNNKIEGSGISGLSGSSASFVMYITSATWYAHITPEDALALDGADYVATLKIAGEDFKIIIPGSVYNAGLKDSAGVQWMPVVATVGEKAYGDLDLALATMGEVTSVRDAAITEKIEVARFSTLVFRKGDFAISGLDNLSLAGGSYDFDPSAYLKPSFVANFEEGLWKVEFHHTDWLDITNYGSKLTAVCTNLAEECDLENRTVSVEITGSGKDYDGKPLDVELVNADDFANAIGGTVSALVFVDDDGTETTTAPSQVGDYTAKATATAKDGTVYKLEKRVPIAATGKFDDDAASLKKGDPAYGTVEGRVLTIDNPSELVYVHDEDGERWLASMTITWPMEVEKKLGVPCAVQYVDEAHAKIDVAEGDDYVNATDRGYYVASLKNHEYTYLKTTTWTVEITPQKLDDAVADGEGYVLFTATLSAKGWGDTTEGCVKGVQAATFTIRIKQDAELVKGNNLADAVVALKADSFDYDFTEHSNAVVTVTLSGRKLTEGVEFVVDDASVTEAVGNGKTDTVYSITVNGIGYYNGTKTVSWTIKAPEREITKFSYGDGRYYEADEAPDGSGVAGYYVGVKLTWPAGTLQFTDPAYAFFRTSDHPEWANATAVAGGEIAGLDCGIGQSLRKYVTSASWWRRIGFAELDAAKAAGVGAITNSMSLIGLRWRDGIYGDSEGIRETDFTVVTELEGLEIFDGDGYRVWPECTHEWDWAQFADGSVITATCGVAGCRYHAKPVGMSIVPSTVAEKYCDTEELTAELVGETEFVEVTKAAIGEIYYVKDSEKIAGTPVDPGEYIASCQIVSADETVTNVIVTTLRILTGQAIWNGVHVADAAEYLEKKTDADMDITIGKDFTASKTFVIPESFEFTDVKDTDYTLADFIRSINLGEFGNLYTKQDLVNLLTGKVTLKDLLARLPKVEELLVVECGIKKVDLAGFGLVAAKDSPFAEVLGALTLVDTSAGQTGSIVTNSENTVEVPLFINRGTLAIDGGTYRGSITNCGALFISDGFIDGRIINAEEGAVVLTGGAYTVMPDRDWIMEGYELSYKDGIYYVKKHEHNYLIVPLGSSAINCTCVNLLVKDAVDGITLSSCLARDVLVCVGAQSPIFEFLPRRLFPYTGEPVPVNVVGYNFGALRDLGLDEQVDRIVKLVKETISGFSGWDEKTTTEKFESIISLYGVLQDCKVNVDDFIWDAARIEAETGMKVGEVVYTDRESGEKLGSAPSAAGRYAAKVVFRTPKGNDITRTWNYRISSARFNDLMVTTDPESRTFEFDDTEKTIRVTEVRNEAFDFGDYDSAWDFVYDAITSEDKTPLIETAVRLLLTRGLLKEAVMFMKGEADLYDIIESLDGKVLVEGVDYTVEGVTSATEAGEYEFTVKGIGSYRGSETVTWKIETRSVPVLDEAQGDIYVDEVGKTVEIVPDEEVRDIVMSNGAGYQVLVPPTVDSIVGVDKPDDIVIVAEAANETETMIVDITEAFDIRKDGDRVRIRLNPKAIVEIVLGRNSETNSVMPKLGRVAGTMVGDHPFVVSGNKVAAGVLTVPGLRYVLKSGDTLGGPMTVIKEIKAKGCHEVIEVERSKDLSKFYTVEVLK